MLSFDELEIFLNKSDIIVTFLDNSTKFKNFNSIGSILNSNSTDITFYNDSKFKPNLLKTKAQGCFIKMEDINFLPLSCIPIIVSDPYKAYACATNFIFPSRKSKHCIKKLSNINLDAKIHTTAEINDFVSIHKNTIIKENVIILNNSVIGPNVIVNKNTFIQSNCVISNATIGEDCLIHSGSIIGDRGFGFTSEDKIEIKHVGNVLIKDNVQIGSNTTIDRASLDSTIIGRNVRIDNLVQIAHNVQIGMNTIIAGQAGIAGSTKIGSNCKIGGQAGISGHLDIGDNVVIAAKSGVTKNLKNNSVVAGFPAIDIRIWKKKTITELRKYK